MSDFKKFSQSIHNRFNELSKHELFVVDIKKDAIWDMYLASFPQGTNPLFRERTEHDCSCCRNFIENLGRVVAIVNGQLQSVWAVEGLPYPYDVVAGSLNSMVMHAPIANLFRSKELKYGQEVSYEMRAKGGMLTWNHLHGAITNKHFSKKVDQVTGDYRTKVQVFKRGLEELTPEAVATVVDLINDKLLYRGEEHLRAVKAFQITQQLYLRQTSDQAKDCLVWLNAGAPEAIFRNTVIGTLVQDLSAGMELEQAVKSFEAKVAPTNYKRPKALITPAMAKAAAQTIHDLGLEDALQRRFATIHDVSVNNVLWVDNSVRNLMKDSVADLLMASATPAKAVSQQAKNIGIDQFMTEVLPVAKGIRIFMRGNMQNQLMSLTAPVNPGCNHLFKWDNDFSWAYNGNLSDSIKEKVKRAGGNTNAALRVSLAWFNGDDLDIHALCPEGHVFFGHKANILDVDMNAGTPCNSIDPVENLSWANPCDGKYTIQVRQYCQRSTSNVGFVLEVENAGKVTQYSYDQMARGFLECLQFSIKNGKLTDLKVLNKEIKEQGLSQSVWGIQTEQYVDVNTLMYSPNFWDDQQIGNKHWFFILKDCLNPEPVRGIFNEYLNSRLDVHRKAFELLGNKTLCPVTSEQLSGLGFSSTRGDIVEIQVSTDKGQQTYNLQF